MPKEKRERTKWEKFTQDPIWDIGRKERLDRQRAKEIKRLEAKVLTHRRRSVIENGKKKALIDIKDLSILELNNYFFQTADFNNPEVYFESADNLFAKSAAHLNLQSGDVQEYFEVRKEAKTKLGAMGNPDFNDFVEGYVKRVINEIKKRYKINDEQLREINYLLHNNPSLNGNTRENAIKYLQKRIKNVQYETKKIRTSEQKGKQVKFDEKGVRRLRASFYNYLRGQTPESVKYRSEHFEKLLTEKNLTSARDSIIAEADDLIKRIENMILRIEKNPKQFEIDRVTAENTVIDILTHAGK
ncbi:MAG: hypothetical protein V1672_04060 [Candidatus Diapherotrites archaeon]